MKPTKNKQKTIIITGASSGLGLAIARQFESKSVNLVLISRHLSKLKELFSDKSNTILAGLDVADEPAVNKLFKQVHTTFGSIDILINNAGLFLDKPLESITIAEYQRIFDTNIKSLFVTCSAAIPIMKKQKQGFILNIGSKISHNTQVAPNKVLYATTKYAVEGFSFALNRELRSSGIKVSCLMPGTLKTFKSLRSNKFLHPNRLAEFIVLLTEFPEIHLESLVIKSKLQDI
jgi:short-subunit dehydrogenase